MRILQISSAKNFGGVERHLVNLCRGLAERGHETFAAVRSKADWPERLSFLPPENLFEMSLRNSFDVFSAVRLARIIREKKIGIVHAHSGRDCSLASLAVRLAPEARLILTWHTSFSFKWVQKIALSNAARVIAVSSAIESLLQMNFPREKVVSVPNEIQIERWAAKPEAGHLRPAFRFQHNIPFDALLVGTIGELKPLEGQEDFVLAAQIVAAKIPKSHFVIVGKDKSFDQNFRRKLKRMVKIFGLEERFLWLDLVEEPEEILPALDAFVFASHSDSFHLSVPEAMACGVALVATATEGAKRLIEHDKTGKLVSIGNPVELASALCAILEDPAKRANFGKQAQAEVQKGFGLERMIDQTEKVYQSVLEKPRVT